LVNPGHGQFDWTFVLLRNEPGPEGRAALADFLGTYRLQNSTIDGALGYARTLPLQDVAFIAITRGRGDLVTFRVVCPACGWRHAWQQHEHELGQFDGLCRECGTRCNGDVPAVVRA
jgi:hypothetical protein